MAFDWKSTLKTVAPMLATALGGPLAGVAVKALSDATLGRPDGTEADIAQAMATGGTDALLKLKAAERQFALDMKKVDVDFEKIHAVDRDSARAHNVAGAVQQEIFWLSVALLLGCIGSEVLVLFRGYPSGVPDIVVGRILGLMDAITMAVLAYWYGTTAGSRSKDALLHNSKPAE